MQDDPDSDSWDGNNLPEVYTEVGGSAFERSTRMGASQKGAAFQSMRPLFVIARLVAGLVGVAHALENTILLEYHNCHSGGPTQQPLRSQSC
jgi:hypothetical protein